MKKHIYRVSGYTKKNGVHKYLFDIEADTAKEARENTVALWEEHRPHLFGIKVERRDDKELEFNFWHRVDSSWKEYFER